VSGGPDSTALLAGLAELRARYGLRLTAAHVDHALRAESAGEADAVAARCAELGVSFARRRVAIGQGAGLEARARRARYRALRAMAAEAGAGWIVTGHTLDDQAETILMRLARGAGPTALLGMREAGPGPIVRPLLDVERAALRSWLARRRIDYREDPSNESLRFERNRVRKLVMTVLAAKVNPKAARHIVEGMRRLREDADYLDAAARAAAETSGAASLESLPKPLAERVRRLLVC